MYVTIFRGTENSQGIAILGFTVLWDTLDLEVILNFEFYLLYSFRQCG